MNKFWQTYVLWWLAGTLLKNRKDQLFALLYCNHYCSQQWWLEKRVEKGKFALASYEGTLEEYVKAPMCLNISEIKGKECGSVEKEKDLEDSLHRERPAGFPFSAWVGRARPMKTTNWVPVVVQTELCW